jgi:EVE domain
MPAPTRRDVWSETMPSPERRTSANSVVDPSSSRAWVIVASRDHARRGLANGFIMTNHGKRAALTRMSPGDGVLIYSPTTTYPKGAPLRAITIVGTVTGAEPEPSDVIANGYRRRAELHEIEPLTLDRVRDHLPTSRLRFGCFELSPPDAAAVWQLINGEPKRPAQHGHD